MTSFKDRLDIYHLHNCRSRQAWVKGMTEPFPCDCGLLALFQQEVMAVIGADEEMATEEFGLDPDEVYMPSDTIREIRNFLRAELRERLKERLEL